MDAAPLHFDLVKQDHLLFVRLVGVIDEHNKLASKLAHVAQTPILINLAKVTRINSCGVRDWVRWVQDLESRQNTLHYLQCSASVVQQINQVNNFCGHRGTVVSFEAPYYCTVCAREQLETLSLATVGATQTAPSAACEKCGELLEFDDLEDVYFNFTRLHATRTVAPEVQASLHKFADAHLATKVAALKELSSGRGAITPGVSSLVNEGPRTALVPNLPNRDQTSGEPTRAADASEPLDEPTKREH